MRKITKRVAIFAAAGAVAVATAGTAWAVWSANGTGSASAAAGSMATVTTSAATLAPGQVLVPGGSANVFLTISNPNSFPVKVTTIADNARRAAREHCVRRFSRGHPHRQLRRV